VKKKLSFKEAKEWEQMEGVVMHAEEVLDRKRSQLEIPEVVSDPARLTLAVQEMDAAQDAVDKLYARWAELEAKQAT
jgi:ATP-binding cassette subfamily F protein uup